jgi:hypothetical protein
VILKDGRDNNSIATNENQLNSSLNNQILYDVIQESNMEQFEGTMYEERNWSKF